MGSAGREIKKVGGRLGEVDPFRIIPKTKEALGLDVELPEFPEFPEPPQVDAGQDALLRAAIIDRIRREAIRGTGRRATIATSPLGITTPAATRRPRATGR
jgi:hypothetical protein